MDESKSQKEYNKSYYLKQKDKKIHCELCDVYYTIYNKYEHFKTKKHQKNEIIKNQEIKNNKENHTEILDKILMMSKILKEKYPNIQMKIGFE
jgi:hypothetical protein